MGTTYQLICDHIFYAKSASKDSISSLCSVMLIVEVIWGSGIRSNILVHIYYYIPPLFFFSPFPVICPYLLALVLELLVLLFLYVPSPFVLPWAKQLMKGISFVLMPAYFFFSSSNRCCSSSICFFCCNFCCSCSFWILSYTIILNCSCRLSHAKHILSLLSLKLVF